MRRALAAAAGTAVGLVGLLGYKSGSAPSRQVVAAAPPTSSQPSSPTVSTTAPNRTTPTTGPAGPADGTYTGPVVSTRFGPVQVRVTLTGGRLVDVSTLQLPFEKPRSAAISDSAAPVLRREALAAQGARIHTVSGATYTSDAYSESLQAALDAARR